MTKLQNVGGYGILAIPTLPAIIVLFHAIRGTLGGALLALASGKAERSQVHQPSCECPPTDFTEFTEAYGRGYSPTDFTDAHRFLGCVFPPNLCTSVQSVGVFVGGYGILPYPRHPLKSSHRFHRIHRSFWRKISSHRFHRCPQMVRLRRVLWLMWEDSLVAAWVWQDAIPS